MDISENLLLQDRKTVPENPSPDAELIALAEQFEALELSRDALFDGIKDAGVRDHILDIMDITREEIRNQICELCPTTLGGFQALGRAIHRHKWDRNGDCSSYEFDYGLTTVLMDGLNNLGHLDEGLANMALPPVSVPK